MLKHKIWTLFSIMIWVSIADMFDNMVTFRKPDATIEFPTFDAATSGDIRFQFRTTAENGIFLQNIGDSHFIEVKLVCKYQGIIIY